MIPADAGERTCSRADCRNDATFRIEWRNPKIHSADRVKAWLGCDEHVRFLHDFLAAREFPLRVVPADSAPLGTAIP